ncbi:hypothetical protein [Actinosynnema sp. NPDC023587]|uniref:hypothetical protein n=1 Tax=Actinosynnema sp. NPDC023587 TaxID=3154695 RepID=UPI00340AB11D
MRKRLTKALLAVGLTLVATFALAQPALAVGKTVTISIGDWNCRLNNEYKGSVSRSLIDVVPGTNPPASWQNGRSRTVNVTYNSGGSAVTIAAVVYCSTGWFSGYYREIAAGMWVNNQTGSDWQI